VLATTAIVWPTSLSVDEYAAAGRDVVVPRQNCPDCAKPMIFWSWYSRTVRDSDDRRIWVRRCRCVPCAVSHALLPAFCLLRRLYSVEVIGPAVVAIVAGGATHQVAEAAGFPYTTTRDWRRRHRDRASTLAAGFAALSVELGAVLPRLASVAERASLEALGCAWAAARARFGSGVAGLWRFWSLVSGGQALSTTTHPPWLSVGGRRLIPPVP